MAFKQIPIFGQGTKNFSPNFTAQRRVNVYYHLQQDQDKQQYVLISTPGLTLLLTLPTSPIRGFLQVGQFAYAVAGSTVYMISPVGGYCSLGTIATTSATPVSLAFNETQICIVDGAFGYVLNNYPNLESFALSYQPVALQQLGLLFDINQFILNTYG